MYKDKIKEIILEEKDEPLENLIHRDFKIDTIAGKAIILTGVRRSGKSTYLRQLIRGKRLPYFYVNFSDERIADLPSKDLGLVLEAFYELEPDLKDENICIGFDEIQIIEGWEYFVDRLVRNKRFSVFITGSSAKMLSQEIATEMRGRSLPYEFFPLSFSEYIQPVTINPKKATTQAKSKMQTLSKKYLIDGSFPEVRNFKKEIRTRILQEYYNTIFFRDVVDRYKPHNLQAVSLCLKLLVNQTAALYSITKLVNKCKSLGVNVSKADVGEFLKWFEDGYLLFSVSIFDESVHRQMTNPRKIYCIDNGLVRAVQSGVSANTGHLLENLVFNILRRSTRSIFYFKEENETDFIVQLSNHQMYAIQACESLVDEKTKNHEIIGLRNAMKTLKLKKGLIITVAEKSIERVNEGEIHILPLWEFAQLFPGL